jgi:hypothetical protein
MASRSMLHPGGVAFIGGRGGSCCRPGGVYLAVNTVASTAALFTSLAAAATFDAARALANGEWLSLPPPFSRMDYHLPAPCQSLLIMLLYPCPLHLCRVLRAWLQPRVMAHPIPGHPQRHRVCSGGRRAPVQPRSPTPDGPWVRGPGHWAYVLVLPLPALLCTHHGQHPRFYNYLLVHSPLLTAPTLHGASLGPSTPLCPSSGSPYSTQYTNANFDNFAVSSAAYATCPAPSDGRPVTLQWCGEPNTANSQWTFDWGTGLLCTFPAMHDGCGLAACPWW